MAIKVLVVDDSALVRQALTEILSRDPEIQVIAAVADPIFAMRRMEAKWPDVIVLDMEMPRMDGLTFLRKIMAEHPTPVVMCSTLSEKSAETGLQAMAAGAVEVVVKPKAGIREFLNEEAAYFSNAIKSAAKVRLDQLHEVAATVVKTKPPELKPQALARTAERIIAIGTSTGGTQALEAVLTALPRAVSGIVIVQHMPEKFTAAFAGRLNALCAIDVKEAADGDRVMPGHALVAPGGRHMMLRRKGAHYVVSVTDGPLVNRHRPSVDVLFRSVAKCAGGDALGIIMTGMGDDGADGMLELHRAGARTIAQNEETCVVYGMPKEAVRRGGVDSTLALNAIAGEIVRYSAMA